MDSTAVRKWVASWSTYTELESFRCVSTTWSHVETPYEVLEHLIWEIAAGEVSELCMATRGGVPRRHLRGSTVPAQVVP